MIGRLLVAALALLWALAVPAGAEVVDAAPREVNGPATAQVWVVESPAVSDDAYAVTGTVAYEGVAGDAYLEMWSVFPDGSRYFSRTLSERGPLAKLSGSSTARPFALPFHLMPDSARPVRLEVNVVLPAAGRVVVSELRFASGGDALRSPGAWWSPERAGLVGGIAGSVVGCFGGLIGTLSSLGRGRRLALGGLLALATSGLALLAAGGVALALGQPHEVWYPLVMLGGLDGVLGFALLPTVRRRFAALELQRLQAFEGR